MYTIVLVSGVLEADTTLLLRRYLPYTVCRTSAADDGVTCWFLPVGTKFEPIKDYECARPVLGPMIDLIQEQGLSLTYVRLPNFVAQLHLLYAFGPDARYNTFASGRRCGKCKNYYIPMEFNKHATSPEGYQSWCRRCSSQLSHNKL